MDEDTQIGPLATESGREDVERYVRDAVDKGATVVVGGQRPDRPGWFYQPTLLTGITPEMDLYAEEVFGPVAALFTVDSLDEAIEIANSHPYGLGSNLWSEDEDERAQFVRDIASGHGVHQRDDHQLPRAALRRGQAERLRPGAHRAGHARVHERQDRVGRAAQHAEQAPSGGTAAASE